MNQAHYGFANKGVLQSVAALLIDVEFQTFQYQMQWKSK